MATLILYARVPQGCQLRRDRADACVFACQVTSLEVSRALLDAASSTDKHLNVYEGMWHALTGGENDANVTRVINDILGWFDARCGSAAAEQESKAVATAGAPSASGVSPSQLHASGLSS